MSGLSRAALVLLILLGAVLVACTSNTGEDDAEKFLEANGWSVPVVVIPDDLPDETGVVEAVREANNAGLLEILVEGDPSPPPGRPSRVWVTIGAGTQILRMEGEDALPMAHTDLREGQRVQVWFEGGVRPSDPALAYGQVVVVTDQPGGSPTAGAAAVNPPAAQGVSTGQDAVDRVFSVWGDEPEFEPFPRTIGTRDGYIQVGGPAPGGRLPAQFETSASKSADGYRVTLQRRWKVNEAEFQTTWVFEVGAGGVVEDPTRTGDSIPPVK